MTTRCINSRSSSYYYLSRKLLSEITIMLLVDRPSKCMPILLYAVEVSPVSQSDIRSLDFAIFRFLMKLLQTNNKDIINDCCCFFNF